MTERDLPRPFSPACERNRGPILAELQRWLGDRRRVLEIGSGTGQHAVHFAAALAHLQWQTSERPEHLPGLGAWLDEAALPNTPPPLELSVGGDWPEGPFDAVFSANTLHIMSWTEVEQMFAGLGRVTTADALLLVYGPFHRNGLPTSPSNAQFDASLGQRCASMGIRDAAQVDALARRCGWRLQSDVPMPAHNQLRIWQRGTGVSVGGH